MSTPASTAAEDRKSSMACGHAAFERGATMRKKPELLAPAGDMEKLRMAVLYGADAVYLAGTSFGMRSFAGNFTADELPEAVRFAPKSYHALAHS